MSGKFNNITCDMVKNAIKKHDNMSEKELKCYGDVSRTYFLLYNDKIYPPKRIIRLALDKTTKELAKDFDFNAIEAKNYLQSIGFEVLGEKNSRCNDSSNVDISAVEGLRSESQVLRIKRNRQIVIDAKQKNNYTCEICGFKYNDSIVHAHHLFPVSKLVGKTIVNSKDLIILCPNCHSIAHYLLRQSSKYEKRNNLTEEIKKINKSINYKNQ